jgi:hypothetical protein
MDPLLDYLSAYSLQANFVRRASGEHPVDRLAAFVRASASCGMAFTLAIGSDGSESAVEDSPDWWSSQLARGDAFQRQFGGVVLTTEGVEATTNAAYNVERGARQSYARVRVDLPREVGGLDLAAWLGDAAEAFGAEVAWVHTSDLLELVRGARAPVDPPSWWSALAPEVVATFANLRPASELDLSLVPEAVWWMNVWSAAAVHALEPALSSAAWHAARTLPSGDRLLVATAAPPDATHLDEIAHVAAITDAIALAQRQRASDDAHRPG